MAVFGNKMMVFGDGSPFLIYQTFKNTVADLTGLNTPTTSGTSYVNGLYSGLPNESILVDIYTDQIIIPNNARFSFVNKASFSIVMAVKLNRISAFNFLLQKRITSSISDSEYNIFVVNGVLRVELYDAINGGYISYYMGNLSIGVNYVIVISYSADNEITCKVNNVDLAVTKTSSGTFVSMRATSSQVSLFYNNWSATTSALGTIDTFAMLNKELTSAEKTDIYTKITTNQSLL